ncbi:MAG: glucosamine-6-phosphate deaminase [Angelakisella sp.]|nr:glucosamine-6-phosphate deaminase [Angelakisella sp.]
MKVIVTDSFEASSKYVAQHIAQLINKKPNAKLGLATGGTCEKIYANLVQMHQDGLVDFSKVSTVNLDEYVGMDPENDLSYRKYMNSNLFDHVNIDKANTYVPGGMGDPDKEISIFKAKVYEGGNNDFQLLGIGVDGHIGFNEAREKLRASAHMEELEESTIEANSRYFEDQSLVPRYAMTMGMADIFSAKEIMLMASGAAKAHAIHGLLMDDYITTQNPSTLLKLHHNVTIVIDKELADLVGYQA